MKAIEWKYLFITMVHDLVDKKITVTFTLLLHLLYSLVTCLYLLNACFTVCKPNTPIVYAQRTASFICMVNLN